jgi:hypothetical protein
MASRCGLALLATVALALLASPAQASDPPVDVLTEGPLTYDLAALRAAGGIEVPLRNTTGDLVEVRVRIEGLVKPGKPDAALAALFDPAGVTKPIPAQSDLDVKLPIAGAKDPKAGSFTGTLLVTPTGTGGVVRRALTLTVAAPGKPAPAGATLDPTGLPDVTLRATNFLPSPLAPVGPTLLVLAALLALVLGIWWRALNVALRRIGVVACLGTIVAGIMLGAVGEPIYPDRDTKPGLQVISSEPLRTSANAVTGRVGIVLDGEGDIGELNVSDGLLHATGLEHAGEHKGKIDLNGDAAEGSAAATVNVRDWWPWALAAIMLGVWAGYRVRSWLDRDRPREQLRLRARAISNRIGEMLRDGAGLQNWIPLQRVDARVAEIERLLHERDTVAPAEEKIKALEAYVEAAGLLRKLVGKLTAAAATYEQAWRERSLSVQQDEISALVAAGATTAGEFDSADLDSESTLLKEAQTRVEANITRVQTGAASYVRINRWIGAVMERLEHAPPDERPALEEKLTKLETEARTVLRATTTEQVHDADARAATEAGDLDAKPPSPLADAIVAAGPIAAIEVQIVVAPGADPAGAGNVDDRFRFRANVTPPPPDGIDVTWAFDDGAPVRPEKIPATGKGEWFDYKFADPGSHVVTLHGPGGSTLDTETVEVTGPSRLTREQGAFAEREKIFTAIVVVLTLASGMLTLYLANPAWGTNQDYVKALLWGAVISEGAAYVAAILAHAYPSGK